MMSLFFMAPPVMAMLGNSGFLALYLFAGASGAVYGVLSYFAAAFPRTTFLIFFVLCVSGLFAWDLWSTFNRPGGRTDSMGRAFNIPSSSVQADH
ncbi:hypothetical protein RQP46_006458 [Phenoliferia psychrophenolica]